MPVEVYLCGYCRHRGGTLVNKGPLKVCQDLHACEMRRAALKDDEREAWDAARNKTLEDYERKHAHKKS